MQSEKGSPNPFIHDLLMKNGAKTSAGGEIYTALVQTTGFRNFNVKPGQGKPSKNNPFFIG